MKLNLEDSFSTVVPNRMAKIALAPDTPVFTELISHQVMLIDFSKSKLPS